MSKDRAFRKILTGKPDDLPEVFEERVMNRILLEIERKSRRSYYLSLVLVFGVSLVMIAGTFFVFHHFFSFDILDLFSDIRIRFEYNPFYTYCFYIAFLVLVLLGLDRKFRQIMKKTGNR
ncbi:MAG: hypothetical protein PHI28_10990 [Mangrovibacterium sp.]|nr:hypothetical protein [Mangrovibacterium sp.]